MRGRIQTLLPLCSLKNLFHGKSLGMMTEPAKSKFPSRYSQKSSDPTRDQAESNSLKSAALTRTKVFRFCVLAAKSSTASFRGFSHRQIKSLLTDGSASRFVLRRN